MAGPLIWSSESLEDIDAIAQFIARDSRHHAQRVVEALLVLGDAIEAQPLAGRAVPELGQSAVRERFLYSYRSFTRFHRHASPYSRCCTAGACLSRWKIACRRQ